MTSNTANLRKAAVLLRSLDADTAAVMLGQLSPEEAVSLRAAMRALGPVDPDEQDEVMAEFRRTRPGVPAAGGVELALSTTSAEREAGIEYATGNINAKRFEFLASAPINALVPYLAREHAQTIAVVLAHLAPERAAAVLAKLPQKLQVESVERLAVLGETDPESVSVLERELATWLAKRDLGRGTASQRRETITNILAAADAATRQNILSNLDTHNHMLAEQIAPLRRAMGRGQRGTLQPSVVRNMASEAYEPRHQLSPPDAAQTPPHAPEAVAPSLPPLPRIEFDQLIHLDTRGLDGLLREVDANVLTLALVGSRDEFIDRICNQMPNRTARAFRRQLRKMGPTRLSDVAGAQRLVAEAAARLLARRRTETMAFTA